MKMRPFEIAILAGFGMLFVVALVLIQVVGPRGGDDEVTVGPVQIWGTVPENSFSAAFVELTNVSENFDSLVYTQLDERTFDDELVNAIAEGRGPDLIFIAHTRLVDQLPKLSLIPYEQLPERDFKDFFIDGAEIYMLPDGIAGFPIAVNPLLMYWNRDILTSNGFSAAPASWEEIVNQIVPTIVRRDFSRNILLSPIALGEYRNVTNAYEIISALMLQGGSRMISVSDRSSKFEIALNDSVGETINPAINAVEFYTSFATVNNPLYSWNRAQPQDKNMFASGDLAIYFGLGSEYGDIARLNPNLNFDVAELPQAASARVKRTYGDIYGLSLLRSADNPTGALAVMNTLSGFNPYYAGVIADRNDFAPAHRATLAGGTADPVDRILYTSALYARGWYNPERVVTETIFQDMIEGVLSVRTTAVNGVRDAMVRLNQQF